MSDDVREVKGSDGGTVSANEEAHVVVIEDDVRNDLPPGHGYEDDDDPERNTTWREQQEGLS